VLKKRVIATLVVKDGVVVQSIGFRKYLPVGKPQIAIEFLNSWGIDEIVLLDISATRQSRIPDFEMVRNATAACYVPLTAGGGITHTDHIRELMHCGADKISLNHAAIHKPSLVSESAHIFGEQCVVVSIDAVKSGPGHAVYDHAARKTLDKQPPIFARECVEAGAGEIFINSVDRDGSYAGYDIGLIQSVCDAVSVPVICAGGARNARDFMEVFTKTNVSGAAAANFFHFTEHSVNITKANICRQETVRLETFADYSDSTFDDNLRVAKKPDQVLEDMLYIRIEKEII
jgi:cyclase